MLYPPCNSVFYCMNPDPEQIDIKKRYQINPELSDSEINAIFNSFDIIGFDNLISYQDESGRCVWNYFGAMILDCLRVANKIPTARLWLRRIPAGMQISYMQEDMLKSIGGLNATATNKSIYLFPESLQKETIERISTILLHELAHIVDIHDIAGLSIFPYNSVTDGDKLRCFNKETLSEAELMQLFLIDEAEKNALSMQLKYESGSDLLPISYVKKMNALFQKYQKMFSNWTPPKEAGEWTFNEIKKERLMRACFYMSAEMTASEIRKFLKPYPKIVSELPKSIQKNAVDLSDASLIDFDKLRNMDFSREKLQGIWDKLSDLQINLGYRCIAYQNLVRYICWQYARQPNNQQRMNRDYFYKHIASNLSERVRIVPNKPSAYFADFVQRMEGRYMGFIRVRELMPQNGMDKLYIHKDNKNPARSLIDIPSSCLKTEALVKKLLFDINNCLYPYYVSRSVFTNTSPHAVVKEKCLKR